MDDADSIIKFRCENCGQKFSVHKNNAGKRGKCPKCKNIIVIPKVQTQSPLTNKTDSEDSKINSKYSAYDLSLLAIPQKDETQELALIPSALFKFAFNISCSANRFDFSFIQACFLPGLYRSNSQGIVICIHSV